MRSTKLPLIERIDAKRASLVILGAFMGVGAICAQQPTPSPSPEQLPPSAAPARAPSAPSDKLTPSTAPVSPSPGQPSVRPLPAGVIPPLAPVGVPGAGLAPQGAPGRPPAAGGAANSPAPVPPPPLSPGVPFTKPLPPQALPPTNRDYLVPTPGYPGAPSASNQSQLSQAIIEEETNPDPNVAKESYKALVQQFDQQRQSAAQAILRLGECYRRLGRLEEARAQYGRIVREFVDFPDLAQQSMRMLSETARQIRDSGTGARSGGATPESAQDVRPRGASNAHLKSLSEMKALVHEQIRVREQALQRARAGRQEGTGSAFDEQEAELRLLEAKERLLALNSAEEMASEQNRQLVPDNAQAAPSADVLVPRDFRVAQVGSQLSQVLSSIAELESEQARQASIFELLKRNAPENLPLNVVSDERYKKLKDAYEEAVASAAGAEDPKAAESSIAFAKNRIQSWLKDIFVPESNVAAEYRKEQIEQLQERAKVLEEQLAQERDKEQTKSAAAARR